MYRNKVSVDANPPLGLNREGVESELEFSKAWAKVDLAEGGP